MKIGIISDVHANLAGLEMALTFLEAQQVDKILCAGDLVDRGDDNEAVVAHMRGQNIPIVQGNHDFSGARNSIYTKATRDFLFRLPHEHRLEREGRTLYMTHAAPWSRMFYVFPHAYRYVFERVIQQAQADIVILGHTHTPMQVTMPDGSMILNPGTTNPNASYQRNVSTCAVLTLADAVDYTVYNTRTGQIIRHDTVTLDTAGY
ncbi:MAG: YfcE family phosphodiesterase [Chloroflexota bacterium]